MIKEGKILEQAVKSGPIKAKDVAMMAGISKMQLHRLYKQDVISPRNKSLLLKAGIDIDDLLLKSQKVTSGHEGRMYIEDLVPTILFLKDQYKLLQDEYTLLSEELKRLKSDILNSASKQLKKQKAT